MKKVNLLLLFSIFAITVFAQEEKKDEFKPHGKIFGEVFGDYFYKLKSDTIYESTGGEYQKNKQDDNAFALRRFYLGYEHQFSKQFSAKLMFEGNDGQLLTNGKKSVNVKYYYLKWKDIFPGSDLIIGGQSTPTWSRFTEKIWGYRSIEKTIMDFRKQGGSNDFGVSLAGKLNADKTIGYNLMIGNGTGQKPEADIFKKAYFSVNAKLFNKKLLLEIYTDFENRENGENKMTIKGFAGFQNEKLTVGFEPFQKIQKQENGDDIKNFGAAFFVRGTIIDKKLYGFGRYDMFNPNEASSNYNESFMVAGFDYTPIKNVHIMPNIWINNYSELNNSVKRSGDVAARVTFWFKF